MQDAKVAKNSPSAHHSTTLSGYIFTTKACTDNRKKVLNSNISSICPHNMVNFGAEIGSGVWSTPANFNGFRGLASLLHWRPSTEVNQTLHDVWPSPGRVHHVYIFRGSCLHNEILPPKFGAWDKEWNYGTFAEGATYIRQGGHYVWHRPTF